MGNGISDLLGKGKSLFKCLNPALLTQEERPGEGRGDPDEWFPFATPEKALHPQDRAKEQDDELRCEFHLCLLSTNLSGLGYKIQSSPNRKHTSERDDGRLGPCTVLGNALNSFPELNS